MSKGLIHSQRNAGNQRRYRRDVLRAVAIIKIAQRIGIPLATIGDAFGVLPEGHNLSAKEWKMLSSQWREAGSAHSYPDGATRPARRLYRLRLFIATRLPAAQPGR